MAKPKQLAPALAQGALNKSLPSSQELLKNVSLRLGLPVLGGWLVAAFFHHWVGYAVMGLLTAIALGFLWWVYQRIEKAKRVTDILQSAQSGDKEDRKAALDKLDATFKKGDVAATFARAQLLIQDSPQEALALLEEIDLTKVLPAEADQARFQRAMIHLARGEVDRARPLVDAIELGRHEDPKGRAMMAAVVGEAWARSGQAKKAMSTLELFNADDATLAEIRPQLWRARAFAAAALNDRKQVLRALRKLASENPQYLSGFLVKKVHPLLEREARQILMQSGAVPRKMQVQRR